MAIELGLVARLRGVPLPRQAPCCVTAHQACIDDDRVRMVERAEVERFVATDCALRASRDYHPPRLGSCASFAGVKYTPLRFVAPAERPGSARWAAALAHPVHWNRA